MIQFHAIVCNTAIKSIPRTAWRFTRLLSSATVNPEQQAAPPKPKLKSITAEQNINNVSSHAIDLIEPLPQQSSLDPSLLTNAKSVNDLLQLVEVTDLSHKDSQQLMDAIVDFMQKNNLALREIETDDRFYMLQQIIASKKWADKHKELTAMYGSLSTSEMIKAINRLAFNKLKDIPTIKYLMNEIAQYSAQLTIAHCIHLMNSMVVFDFQHKVLLNKICKQITNNNSNTSAETFLSLAVLFSKLRYRDNHVLDVICTCVLYKDQFHDPHKISTLLQTLAHLSYKPAKVEVFINQKVYPLEEQNFGDKVKWLNLVYSLVQFNMATPVHYESVFSQQFLQQVNKTGGWNHSNKLKLLNIQASAKIHFGQDWSLPDLSLVADINETVPHVSRYKQVLLTCLDETLKDILPPDTEHVTNVKTDMGISIDAVCYVNDQGQYVSSTAENSRRVAFILCTLADYCRGESVLVGHIKLQERLLKENGYIVVILSEKHFSSSDILLKRAKYVHLEVQKASLNKPEETDSQSKTS